MHYGTKQFLWKRFIINTIELIEYWLSKDWPYIGVVVYLPLDCCLSLRASILQVSDQTQANWIEPDSNNNLFSFETCSLIWVRFCKLKSESKLIWIRVGPSTLGIGFRLAQTCFAPSILMYLFLIEYKHNQEPYSLCWTCGASRNTKTQGGGVPCKRRMAPTQLFFWLFLNAPLVRCRGYGSKSNFDEVQKIRSRPY